MARTIWTTEMIDQLSGLISSGMTAAKAGEVMGFSKAAIIGKCSRAGVVLSNQRKPPARRRSLSPAALRARRIADRRMLTIAIMAGKIMPCVPRSSKLGTDLRAAIPGKAPSFPDDKLLAVQLRTIPHEELAAHYGVTLSFIGQQVTRIGAAAYRPRVRRLPPDEELVDLLLLTPWAEIAETYGVTKPAVYRAAERLRVPKQGIYRPPVRSGRRPKQQVAA